MQDKTSLRKEILAKRDNIPPAVKTVKDNEIEERLFSLEEFRESKTVFLFVSFRSEVRTVGLISRSLTAGKRVMVPRVEGQDLGLYEIKGLDELVPGYMTIPEPSVLTAERRIDINDIDLIIIPGAAFDEAGNRIGYGGGFYDRLLAGLQKQLPVIAPAYEEQVVASVPVELHDRKVSMIVTDRRIIRAV